LVVDDLPIVRAGLRTLLEREDWITVVADAADTTAAALKMRRHQPDVLVLDVRLACGGSVEAIERLRKEAPGCRVLLLYTEDHRPVRQAYTSGADGYLLKETAAEGLIAAVRTISLGGLYVDPKLAVRILIAENDPLSDRERELLQLLARGHTNAEIARMLHISARTAESHRRKIMQKLSLGSRAELVRYALRSGMLERAAPTRTAAGDPRAGADQS
jgi:DNA-binding NarL/FixJ family response regulator